MTNIYLRRLLTGQSLGSVIGVSAMLVLFTLIDFNGWWNTNSLANVLQFSAILGLLSMGLALVIIAREIDLSVGSVYGLAGVSFVTLEPVLGVPMSFIAAMALAALIGLLQGLAVVRLKLPSMIVTLGGLFSVRGVIYVWTGGTVSTFSADARTHWLTQMFGGHLLGLPAVIWWTVLVAVLLSVMLLLTRFGNHLLATGGQQDSAESRGVRTDHVKLATFVLCSMLAGLSGIITLCDNPQTHVTLGELMELEAIAAAVIGGCLLTGGRGSLIGALLGTFIVVSVRYELIALGAPSSWYMTFVGAVLIAAVIFNQYLANKVNRSL
ncbi:ABC transporter permease [Rhodoferax sp. GW822-FHT02A01]|uniref:ABC transporter permease n=1 Tax=Rhodoferax sp. GW822-FHT02A01 TaxID=3141537 RepID=UPI00315C6D91